LPLNGGGSLALLCVVYYKVSKDLDFSGFHELNYWEREVRLIHPSMRSRMFAEKYTVFFECIASIYRGTLGSARAKGISFLKKIFF